MTNKKAAPVEEQQISSPNDTTTNLADAIRLACYANGIDHDVVENIVGSVFARYCPRPDEPLRELIHSLDPGVNVKSEFLIHEHTPGDVGRRRSKEQAQRIACAIIDTLGGEYITVTEKRGSEYDVHWISVEVPRGRYDFAIIYTPEEGAQ
jgi:hypothetical protein